MDRIVAYPMIDDYFQIPAARVKSLKIIRKYIKLAANAEYELFVIMFGTRIEVQSPSKPKFHNSTTEHIRHLQYDTVSR
jgi:hypothetical protein